MKLLVAFDGPDPETAKAEQFAAVWIDKQGKLRMTASPGVPQRVLDVFREEQARQLRNLHHAEKP